MDDGFTKFKEEPAPQAQISEILRTTVLGNEIQSKEALEANTEKTEECDKLHKDARNLEREVDLRQNCVDEMIAQTNTLQIQQESMSSANKTLQTQILANKRQIVQLEEKSIDKQLRNEEMEKIGKRLQNVIIGGEGEGVEQKMEIDENTVEGEGGTDEKMNDITPMKPYIADLQIQSKEALEANTEKTEECDKLHKDARNLEREVDLRQNCVDEMIAQTNTLQIQQESMSSANKTLQTQILANKRQIVQLEEKSIDKQLRNEEMEKIGKRLQNVIIGGEGEGVEQKMEIDENTVEGEGGTDEKMNDITPMKPYIADLQNPYESIETIEKIRSGHQNNILFMDNENEIEEEEAEPLEEDPRLPRPPPEQPQQVIVQNRPQLDFFALVSRLYNGTLLCQSGLNDLHYRTLEILEPVALKFLTFSLYGYAIRITVIDENDGIMLPGHQYEIFDIWALQQRIDLARQQNPLAPNRAETWTTVNSRVVSLTVKENTILPPPIFSTFIHCQPDQCVKLTFRNLVPTNSPVPRFSMFVFELQRRNAHTAIIDEYAMITHID